MPPLAFAQSHNVENIVEQKKLGSSEQVILTIKKFKNIFAHSK